MRNKSNVRPDVKLRGTVVTLVTPLVIEDYRSITKYCATLGIVEGGLESNGLWGRKQTMSESTRETEQ